MDEAVNRSGGEVVGAVDEVGECGELDGTYNVSRMSS